MKNLFKLLIIIFVFSNTGIQAQISAPDLSFGNNGVVITDINGHNDAASEMAIQTDGKIVVAGNGIIQSYNEVIVARYKADGSLDSTFGINGLASVTVGTTHNYLKAVAIQTDGKIIAAGYYGFSSNANPVVIRLNTNGTPDSTFGTAGVKLFGSGNLYDEFHDLALQTDGKIIVAGRTYQNNTYSFLTMRLMTDGSPDNTFGTNGKVVTDFLNANDCIYSVALLSGGKILVSGTTTPGSTFFAAARYYTNGTPDLTFGTNGTLYIGSGSRLDICYGMAIQSDSCIVLAGTHHNSSTDQFMIVRLTSNGVIDNTFGTNGITLVNMTNPDEALKDVIVLPDGKILGAGSGAGNEAMMLRLTNTGTPDLTFGANGIYSGNVGGVINELNNIVLMSDSSVIACGFTRQGVNDNFLVVKALADFATGLENPKEELFTTNVYPNPAHNYLVVQPEFMLQQEGIISIADLNGRSIFQQNFEVLDSSIRVSLPENITSGMYLLNVRCGNKISRQKFIVQ